ncbi:hypothetical protein [Streptomyces sp. NPDC058953]|uniref:hypothetical protein n=1 Tax=unclassified Streptomyces TaxID=2593676 RepID=UPI0036842301
MRNRPRAVTAARIARLLFALLASVLLVLGPLGAGAASAAPTAGTGAAAAALREGPVYIDPRAASQLSARDADALADRIRDADKPLFVAVLPDTPDFDPGSVLRTIRSETGVTGLYAVRLGDGFDAGADASVLAPRAVNNAVDAVRTPTASSAAPSAATQLNAFVDLTLPQLRGHAPDSWSASGAGSMNIVPLITVGALLVAGGVGGYTVLRRNRRRKRAAERAALDRLRVVVDEDITAYGEELDRLDFHPAEPGADDAMRADYERALDSYERAKSLIAAAGRPADVTGATRALEDGRFSLAVLDARRTGRPPPERRPPCFFDPRHGPSVTDTEWAPDGRGAPRPVPVCAADAARLADGREPMARTVATEDGGRRPYWEAGPAYGPWAGGYFAGGILPALLAGTLLGGMLATPAYADEYGGGEFSGGDYSGTDFNPSDFGGDGGGGGGFGGGDGFGGGGGDFGGGF